MNNTRRKALVIRITLGVAAALAIAALAHTDPAPSPAQAPTAGVSDLQDEIWWTTTDCPAGVQVPCLDPTADPDRVPAEVAAQLRALVDAQWVCIEQVGQPMPDGTVRVTHDQLQQCRQYAYAATRS